MHGKLSKQSSLSLSHTHTHVHTPKHTHTHLQKWLNSAGPQSSALLSWLIESFGSVYVYFCASVCLCKRHAIILTGPTPSPSPSPSSRPPGIYMPLHDMNATSRLPLLLSVHSLGTQGGKADGQIRGCVVPLLLSRSRRRRREVRRCKRWRWL